MNCKARQRKVTSIIFFVCEKNYFSTLCRRFRVKRGYPHVGKLMNIIIFAIFKNQFVVLSHDLSAQRFLDAINSSSREKSYFFTATGPVVFSIWPVQTVPFNKMRGYNFWKSCSAAFLFRKGDTSFRYTSC